MLIMQLYFHLVHETSSHQPYKIGFQEIVSKVHHVQYQHKYTSVLEC